MGSVTGKMRVLSCRLARSTLLLFVLLVNNAISDEPSLQTRPDPRLRPYNRFVAFQGFHGARLRIDVRELLRDQAAAGWAEDSPATASPGANKGTTYSVIVVQWR